MARGGADSGLGARDALAALRDDAGEPTDLREKALEFAAADLRFCHNGGGTRCSER